MTRRKTTVCVTLRAEPISKLRCFFFHSKPHMSGSSQRGVHLVCTTKELHRMPHRHRGVGTLSRCRPVLQNSDYESIFKGDCTACQDPDGYDMYRRHSSGLTLRTFPENRTVPCGASTGSVGGKHQEGDALWRRTCKDPPLRQRSPEPPRRAGRKNGSTNNTWSDKVAACAKHPHGLGGRDAS